MPKYAIWGTSTSPSHAAWVDAVGREFERDGFTRVDDVLEAVKAGATGYLVKSASRAEMIAGVIATADGQAVFTPGLAGLVLGEFRRMSAGGDPEKPVLSPRETEVLRYVAKGMTAKQIAAKLFLSHRTVENHVQAALRKLQLANRVELARYAIEHGLDEEPTP